MGRVNYELKYVERWVKERDNSDEAAKNLAMKVEGVMQAGVHLLDTLYRGRARFAIPFYSGEARPLNRYPLDEKEVRSLIGSSGREVFAHNMVIAQASFSTRREILPKDLEMFDTLMEGIDMVPLKRKITPLDD